MDIDQAVVEKGIEYALSRLDQGTVSASFNEAYSKAVQSLPGQANAIQRWNDLGQFCQKTVKGKEFKKALRKGLQSAVPESGQARKLGNMSKIYEGCREAPICNDLREHLQSLIDG